MGHKLPKEGYECTSTLDTSLTFLELFANTNSLDNLSWISTPTHHFHITSSSELLFLMTVLDVSKLHSLVFSIHTSRAYLSLRREMSLLSVSCAMHSRLFPSTYLSIWAFLGMISSLVPFFFKTLLKLLSLWISATVVSCWRRAVTKYNSPAQNYKTVALYVIFKLI